MSKTEAAPSPRGLSLLRRNKGNKSSTSLLSNEPTNDVGDKDTGIKASFDNVIDRVRKSVDDGRRDSESDVSPHRRLSTMFKRKKKGDKDENGQRRSAGDDLSLQPTISDSSRLQASRSSSLLTDDISDDEALNLRPTLSAHSSHRGFLTLSSPAVNTQTGSFQEPPSLAALTQPSTVSIPSIIEPEEDEISPIRQSFTFPASHRTSAVSALSGLQSSAIASEPVLQQYNNDERPETPLHLLKISTAEPETPPNRPGTPSTLVTPPTPTLDSHERSESPDRSGEKGPRRRRALSAGQPSKLSKSIPAPLTPTVEETKTPGGTLTQPNNATGFFSSVFSAAQKAADQLSHTITVPGTAKSKDEVKIEDTQNSADATDMTSSTELPQSQSTTSSAAKSEEEAAALAVSNAYEKPNNASLHALHGRPLSIASTERLTLGGERSPSRQADEDEGGFLKRGGSIRSRISGHRRNRGSSSVTANGVGAALKESATGLSQVATSGQGHRMTGFAVASKKRNKDFHQQFRSVPEDDYLIEDYSAALQRDILLHGRLYVSEGHICFSSNILGWVTNLVMNFDEIVAVEKKSTAVIFPNAIVIQTIHAKNTFASFVARDSTYELIIGIWKINHPNLKSSLNGVALEDSGTGDKTEKAESIGSNESDTESDEFYDEDAEDDGKASYVEGDTTKSVNGSEAGDDPISRKPSGAPVGGESQQNGTTKAREINDSAAGNSSAANTSSLGPDTHAPTECEDKDSHYDKPLTDTTIPAPLGKVYSLMFGPGSGAFMGKWLVDDQKSRELDMKDDKIGLDSEHKSMTFSYIKPLGGSVGPKQTKCITTNTVEAYNLEKAVSISCSTQTPDVPSGNAFLTKTKYCLMWGPDNSTRLVANCTVEWSAKSWLKGPIEKGAQDGQTQYVKDLVAALKAAVSTAKPAAKGALKKGKKKGKKDDEEETPKSEPSKADSASSKSNWGPLEPLHAILEPLLDIVRPFITSQVVIAVLFVLLVYTWISPPGRTNQIGLQPYTGAERTAMYEDLWRREENELWDWLEDRVGVDDLYSSKLETIKDRQKVLTGRQMSKKIKDEKMSSRELDEAIKITEQKLDALKGAVESSKKPVPGSTAVSSRAKA